MGLFQTMRPSSGSAMVFIGPVGGYAVRLTARVGSTTVASAAVRRQPASAVGVTSRVLTVAHDGVHGRLYLPEPGGPRRPGVLTFGGSEGGEADDFGASLLAAHGYPALSLAYFKASGVPRTLESIPLEYFVRALRILRRTPGVDPARLVVKGGSRGSEAAMLLGTHFPRLVYAVVVGSPADHANFSVGGGPSWTLHGTAVPTAAPADFDNPRPADAPDSLFAVAKVRGPIMTVCGEQDLLWPSCASAAVMAAARREAGRSAHDVHLAYPDAGHYVDAISGYYSLTQQPTSSDGTALGGSLVPDLQAAGEAHQALLAFLARL